MTSSDFLREYFHGTEGRIYIGALRNPKSALPHGEIDHITTRNSGDVDKFVARYDQPKAECAIYFCTATIQNGHTTRKDADCWQFPSLFADCDDHNHHLDRTRVIELLEGAECPPTLIINSGHGLQPHWLLSEPSEDADRIIASRKKLQALVASDAVHDAPRYMRLPGSHNSKGGDWLQVEVVSHHPERRYAIEVIEEWLDIATVIIPRKVKEKAKGNGAADDKPFVLPPSAGPVTDPKRGAAWARKALEESARELANAAEGSRHNTLRDKSIRMATMISRGWIDVQEIRRALFAAAQACGQIKDYGVTHFEQTFAAGLKYGLAMPHPDLPNDDPSEFPDRPRSSDFIADEPRQEPGPPPALPFVDMSSWDNEPVPDQEWAVLNRIPLRQTVLFSGEGSAGKSTAQLHLSAAHALGRDWLGTMPEPGPAIYVDAEDDKNVMHRRLAAIANHYQATFAELINGGLHLISLAGHDAVLAAASRNGKIEPTTVYKQLLEAARDIRPKMIGIASSANVYAGSEIDRSQVQQFIGLLTRIAIVANGSLVLISHPSLAGIATDTGLSGNTQWHNAVRARFYMKSVKPESGEQPDTDLREIVFKKNNYGPVSENIALRYTNGLFLPVPGMASLDKAAHEAKAEQIFLDLLRRFTKDNRNVSDRSGPSYAPALFAREDEAKSAGLNGKALEGAMRHLFKAGKIWNEEYGRPSRPNYRLALKG